MLAVAVVVPPVYVYMTDQDYDKLFPVLKYSKEFLRQVTDARFGKEEGVRGVADLGGGGGGGDFEGLGETQTPREKYK